MSASVTNREERRWALPRGPYLESQAEVRVRFQEVDSLRIVWHGHYLTYCEEGRLAFGGEFGLGYDDLARAELAIPLIHAEVDFHAPALFGDRLCVRTRLHPVRAAQLQFRYRITREGPADPSLGGPRPRAPCCVHDPSALRADPDLRQPGYGGRGRPRCTAAPPGDRDRRRLGS